MYVSRLCEGERENSSPEQFGENNMRKISKNVATVSANVSPSLASVQNEAQALLTRIISENPDAARAVALQSIMRSRTARTARVASPEMSEADRAVAAANMSAGFRQTLFRALLAKGPGDYTTNELATDTGIALYRVRGDLQTIANRLADVEKFPGIGYRLSFVEGKRGLEQTVRFVSLAPKPRKAKGKAVAIVAPAPIAPTSESEGE
jgi:hypothetical protein